ncbi:Cysteine desulfurase [Lactobacillus equicursoris DSM 19284 = JCM 14600 = CIP 110162]|uniref:Cysteine desulfurase n=3 Tax=Lactobacillus equicursoris TaxID=420645 RepID=K0NT76_9LACO|nr:cysteine desulfurase family protein [Lactobacillus equicursoris]KRL02356.1 cysteine desulfurase [Lactobacillus equicursoris DSM 19284 = JCM 14600 = CIP 110162]MDD6386322.1 cysteine desulfurase family protein [Lactobacillus equicursoris]MST79490.1 cysteine desulfurase [Lactobacillus equicursoris]CCK85494.1 Cysteine desulfurase [Lactobacillus equicursoris DSM 19284 = JCM 14600 = CIP 110162]
MEQIYLDNAATTPMSPAVIDLISDEMKNDFGNASSTHGFGRKARNVVESARHTIAQAINAKDQEIIFTSGGSESNNNVIFGVAELRKDIGKHLITTKIEHESVLRSMQKLESQGYSVTYLDVDRDGRISLDDLKQALTPDTILVSVMAVNNEVGTVNPLKEIGEMVAETNAYFHVDAVQGLGNIDLDVQDMKIDFMSTSAHKINGPKFLGFLYERDGIRLPNLIYGGDQELKRRAGTENVPGIAGFGLAVEETQEVSKAELQEKYTNFQKLVLDRLDQAGIDYEVNSPLTGLVSHHVLNLRIKGASTYLLIANLDLAGFAISGGSACTAGSLTPSHVLTAMFGPDSPRISESIRVSFGRYNTAEEVAAFADALIKVAKRMQEKKTQD